MPYGTFFNLPADKQKAIFEAAVQEFSAQRFSEASINQIVKSAQIPRGSFYQYFSGKPDIFAYVMDTIAAELQAVERENLSGYADGDALTQFMGKLASTIALNRSKPEYVRIAMMQAKEDDPFVKRYYALRDEHKQAVIMLFERDKQRGLIRDDVDAAAVIDMVYLLSMDTFYSIGADGDAYFRRMEAYIEIIRSGIGRRA